MLRQFLGRALRLGQAGGPCTLRLGQDNGPTAAARSSLGGRAPRLGKANGPTAAARSG